MEYNFRDIEKKWQAQWIASGAYKTSNNSTKPKAYVLDMFPYPSGAGLHVGHPLGYVASDIYARYKRLKGFNVLHPMGYDAFGLPAEQYAIERGIHPAVSTGANIETFRRQLDNIGFGYDWSREVRTCDPSYYKWTQWIFLQLFESFYNRRSNKAEKLEVLIASFEKEGNAIHSFPNNKYEAPNGSKTFTAEEWKKWDELAQREILMQYRLAYLAYTDVNWCEALGTVLANDEVINGVSYRGGFPVIKKKMRQWNLRITEYAERLLQGLEVVDFSDSMKEIQRNWIGKSYGAEINFKLKSEKNTVTDMTVFTTRPDTIFGVDFMVVAPEHEMVKEITAADRQQAVDEYLQYVQSRSEVERMAEVKKITGCFTGAYAINPFNGREIPVWISEYVLAGYGTGAIMAVPCGDERDHKFAVHFDIPITNIIGDAYDGKEANPTKDAILGNSDFLNGMVMRDAIEVVLKKVEELGIGKSQVNFKMRDAGWSRQRYWGEPFPIVFKNDIPYAMDPKDLPLELPPSDDFKPSGTGEGPLANIPSWVNISDSEKHDTNTMPTHAGAAWYFLRYTDPHNTEVFADRKALDYWGQVDVYVGGSEHAVAHLLYSRLWVKVLHDLGYLGFDEPFKKLINQGKITAESKFVYRVRNTNQFVSAGLKDQYEADPLHVDINIVDGLELDIEAFKKWTPDFADASFILEDGKYICGAAIEKMSKSYFNVSNPDQVVAKYGADTFRMYEMFLGPLEASKPWDVKGIEGVHRFLKKFWRLFYDETKGQVWTNDKATDAEWKVIHKAIKKIEEDTERWSFNTAVSAFMVCVNELNDLKCTKKEALEKLIILLTPYAPHVSEELWHLLGNAGSVLDAAYPVAEEKYLVETSKEYPISINGKLRTTLVLSLEASQQEVEQVVLANDIVQKWLEGKPHKKIIFVKGKMVNVVI
ncbi:leucine--tRNA ligase [Pseudobacter ginsenosidimutans]|uniref:Leucine--tRNA ligase n=1 Tax=Pseudobacter ginsenosidimutans TaxID=661488 RepID=A0A4Q7MR21_9BACT|nr:leucine--tRNA ligase [Pseudobacter ginsenosidimutans]QEC41972.1 leucine--tRNA ligase [Pseudobacter ginsenosidimutans]RZS71202.1 leucyl-tRNA synthetase [Pseudobacter ginsenosidimutans]